MAETTDGPFFFTGDDALSVACDLLNTIDLLAQPADRLTTVDHLAAFLTGHDRHPSPLTETDLDSIRRLREQVRAIWQSTDIRVAAERLNNLLLRFRPVPRLRIDGDAVDVTYGDPSSPAGALVDEVLAALAHELARHGLVRLGTCAGDPCRCVFVDRSRNRNRRYCCDICTSRAAAAAYRQRQRRQRSET